MLHCSRAAREPNDHPAPELRAHAPIRKTRSTRLLTSSLIWSSPGATVELTADCAGTTIACACAIWSMSEMTVTGAPNRATNASFRVNINLHAVQRCGPRARRTIFRQRRRARCRWHHGITRIRIRARASERNRTRDVRGNLRGACGRRLSSMGARSRGDCAHQRRGHRNGPGGAS
jgi:hypothetical protein